MSKLHIIGNGFDLWHGLPTKSEHFYEFCKDDLNELESYYAMDTTDGTPWCEFEESLGTFNWSLFYEAYDNTDISAENFRASEAFGLEDELKEQTNNLVEAIREKFREWIDEIDCSEIKQKTTFAQSDRFLTFNYTSTLQSVYGVDDNKVFHIHGKSERFDELIFGHGETIEEVPELDDNGESNRTMFSDAEGAAKYPFYALLKPVNEVIDRNRGYFEGLLGVTEIRVIGHSINEIDLPYFRMLAKITMGCRWVVFCYEENKKHDYIQQLLKCSVSKTNIKIRKYSYLENL